MPEKRKRGRPRKPRPPGLAGELARAVEGRRKGLGWTALRLARRARLGLGTVLRVEAGTHSPALDTLLALAHALSVSGAGLLSECPAWNEAPTKG